MTRSVSSWDELEGHPRVGVLEDGWWRVSLPELPWEVELRVARVDGVPRILGLRITPARRHTGGDELRPGLKVRDVVISTESVRRLPLARMLRAVLSVQEGDLKRASKELGVVERGRGAQWPDEHYRLVAGVYRAAVNAGRPPNPAICARWEVSRAAASKWIRRARDLGYIGPPLPGRAGEQEEQ